MNVLPYRRLYLRMALHIGAALVAFILLGLASFAFIATWQLAGYVETRHGQLGQEAAQVLARGGRPALERWLGQEALIPDDVRVYILDDTGTDILGRSLPPAFERFVQSSLLNAAEPASGNFRRVRLAPELLDNTGRRYIFLPVPRDITLWGSPSTALALLAAALLVVATVAWLIARAFGRPIGELQQAVRKLAKGDISTRVPARIAGRHDELGELAADFNAMAEQLEQLIAGREELMREMSHELRSPLTRLQAALALAMARDRLQPTEHKRIEQEIAQMNRVIGALLRYSSLNAAINVTFRLVRIDELLARLLEVEELEARNQDCALALECETDLTVAGDPELLRSAFENILRNAIRFSPAGSSINLAARRETLEGSEWIITSISDRGPGIAKEHLERVFEPYVRVARNDRNGGTGLGLAIVKRSVERHGGKVRATQREDGGLTVTVWLPAAELS